MRGWARELVLLILVTTCQGIYGDPQSLVVNGDFEMQVFRWAYVPQMDVLNQGEMNHIPFFIVIAGGVQVVNQEEYVGPPWSYGGKFSLHLNSGLGPGAIQTTPLVTPRWGATYNLTFDIADNPDGGPVHKGVRVVILVNNQKSGRDIPLFNVSNPNSQRSTIVWNTMSYIFVGAGESTSIVFESLCPGSFGALIDNIKVRLLNLIENGSFEFTYPPGPVRDNQTSYAILAAPSSVITSWTVATGFLKWSGDERWQSSTDESKFMLDMNANNASASIISNPIPTKVDATYMLLFDTAANPDPTIPTTGTLVAEVVGNPKNNSLAVASIGIDGTGFSIVSVGWRTTTLEFIARDTAATIQFTSKVIGDSGPLLDNVQVFQVTKLSPYMPRAPSWASHAGKGSAAAYGRPTAIFVSSVAGALFFLFSFI